MESSVLVAIITAITSITVALIQMTASLRVASLKTPPEQPAVRNELPQDTATELSHYRAWLQIGTILVVSNLFWLVILGTELSFLLQFGAVLWCTSLLAYFRPIRWPYVAGVVTLCNVIWLIASYFEIGPWAREDLVVASLVYIANALVATLVAYRRMRTSAPKNSL